MGAAAVLCCLPGIYSVVLRGDGVLLFEKKRCENMACHAPVASAIYVALVFPHRRRFQARYFFGCDMLSVVVSETEGRAGNLLPTIK